MGMTEQWKPVCGYEGVYEVSDAGNVKRVAPGRRTRIGKILQPSAKAPASCYLYVNLCAGGKTQLRYVHILVAEAFIGPKPTRLHWVRHINGDISDNRACNLAWWCKKTPPPGPGPKKGEQHHSAKLTAEDVRIIRSLREQGNGLSAIASRFGVSEPVISRISNRRIWAHIK